MIGIRRFALWCSLAAAAACGGDREGKTIDSADGELDIPRRKGPPYQAVPVTEAGRITGTVAVAAPPPPPAAGPCAGQAPTGAAPVVVFLEDIPRGLALPRDASRRFELTAGSCELSPRVTVATAGGTLNFSNAVRFVHYVAFTFEGMKNPMVRMPFSDPGQLVPSERVLAVPGIVDVQSDQDPSVRARIVVVEHPYAVTTTDGQFTIDSVPPGSYTLVAVGPAGRAESRVTVQAGNSTTVALQVQ